MAVTVRSVGISPGANSETVVIVKPVGLTVGDLMVAQVVGRADSMDVFTAPANWTTIRQDGVESVASFASALFWKIADADDVAAANFTFMANGDQDFSSRGAMIAIEVDTFDSDTPINANSGDDGDSATPTAPTITPSVANCLIGLFIGMRDSVTESNYAIVNDNPASWTEAYDLPTNLTYDISLAMAYAIRPETSATGNGTADSSGDQDWTGQLLAIAPPGEPPGPTFKHIPHCGPRKKRTEFFPTLSMGG